MIPEFNESGLLPAGVHRCSFEEFERRFVYFDLSDRRCRVFDKLRELYRQASELGIVRRIIVGGSFITSKPEPNDFDCILVLDPSIVARDLQPIEYNLVSMEKARRIFGGDVFPLIEGTPKFERFIEFFQSSRQEDRVGVVEIEL